MQTILITGAAKRIGKQIALAMASRGWQIAVHHHDSQAEADETVSEIKAAGGKAFIVQADLSVRAESEELIAICAKQAGGPITALVNNASVFENDDVLSANNASWDRHMEVNLHAPFILSQALTKQMPEGEDGNIINIIDQRVLKLNPQFMSYTLSKSGLWTLTRTLAQSLAPSIRVNAIGPGPTLVSTHQSNEDFNGEASSVMLGKGPDVKEIASTVAYILDTPSMTGQMIALDGGQHLAWQTPDID